MWKLIAAQCLLGISIAGLVGCMHGAADVQSTCDDSSLYDDGHVFAKRLGCYLNEVKEVFNDKDFADDFVVGSALTTREYQSKYEVVYADYERTFFSYRAECFAYTGGAHGSTIVGVGTIDVKSGQKLKVDDVIPADKCAEALSMVQKAVISKIGGEDNLQGEVTLTENFYVGGDGLHFVFNEYEVACYAQGLVEVVIPAYGKYIVPAAE